MAKFTIQPMREFQHLKGWFLGRTDRRCKVRRKALILVHQSQKDALCDHFYKIYILTTKSYSPN